MAGSCGQPVEKPATTAESNRPGPGLHVVRGEDNKTVKPLPVLFDLPNGAPPAGNCVALVIGNGAYRAPVNPLPNTGNDAKQVAERLRSAGGCEVFYAVDLASPELSAERAKFLQAIRPGVIVYFYYSGHGGQISGQNLLLAVDVGDIGSTAGLLEHSIELSRLLDEIRERSPSAIVAILDSCRSSLAPQTAAKGIVVTSYSLEYTEPNTILIYAAPNGGTANAVGSVPGLSLFTGVFLRYFVRGQDIYTAFHQSYEGVMQASANRQQPWIDFRGAQRICLGGVCGAPAQQVAIGKVQPTVSCASSLPFPYVEGNLWGYLSCDGRIAVPAQYSSAWRFSTERGHELAPVRLPGRHGKMGYIDPTGRSVIEPRFDEAYEFRGGLAPVCVNHRCFFIGYSGNQQSPMYFRARPFRRGLAPVQVAAGNGREWGYISPAKASLGQGRAFAIPPQFEDAQEFGENGLAAVKVGGRYGFIDHTGRMVITPQFDPPAKYADVMIFHEGIAPAMQDGLWGFIDETGQWKVTPRFGRVKNFHEGLAAVQVPSAEGAKWGYIDRMGEFVIAPSYDNAYDFTGNVAIVRPSGKNKNRLAPINRNGVFLRPASEEVARR